MYAGVPHFPPTFANFLTAGSLLLASLVPRSQFGSSCRFPCLSFPVTVIVFCLPPAGAVAPEVALLLSSSTPIAFGLFAPIGAIGTPECPGAHFGGHDAWGHDLQLEGLHESLVHRLLFSRQQLDFYGGIFYPAERFAWSILIWSSSSAG